jgi:hypothetical protein
VFVAETKGALYMKVSKLLAVLFGAALVLSSSVLARESNKSALHLSDKVTVQGKSLNSGDYTVEWTGSGSAVEVTILKGKQTVATLSGRMIDQATSNPGDAYGIHTGSDGSQTLTTIYPAHKKVALQLDQSAEASQAN